jgi:hypothetical protein
LSTRYDTGGTDVDGDVYDASFECDDCGLSLSWPVTDGLPAAQDPVAAPMLAMIAEHEDGGCPSQQLQQVRLRQFPKDLYFNAEDHNTGPDALPESELAVIRNQRYAMHRRLCTLLEDLQIAVKPLKAFDRNGNIGTAAANLMDTALEAQKILRNFTLDIAFAEQRYREVSNVEESPTPTPAPASVVEPSPQVRTDAGHKPKPGPHLVSVSTVAGSGISIAGMHGGIAGPGMASVQVFNPDQSVAAQLSAFDRVIAARAANTRRIR